MSTVLPAINATLNGIATCLLVAGYIAIKRGRRETHRRFMLIAFVTSALFLSCYLVKHALYEARPYGGPESLKTLYYLILATHVPLAALMVVPILILLRLGLKGRIDRHRRLARWVFPVWMYVSITGVAIYLMLYHLSPVRA